MTKRKAKEAGRESRSLVGVIAFFLITVIGSGAGYALWQRWSSMTVDRIEVQNYSNATQEQVLKAAGVEIGQLMSDVKPGLIEDLVTVHPWVESARVTRSLSGNLFIDVREREPAALVIDRKGQPSHYLGGDGKQMPIPEGSPLHAVPLLRDLREPYTPGQRVRSPVVRRLLSAFANMDSRVDALVSEAIMTRDDEVILVTTSDHSGRSFQVQLGDQDFDHRLLKLEAFWHQAIVPQPELPIRTVDLRFDSQIITKE